MNRRHKSRFWPNEGMRSLQAQIDELWAAVGQLSNSPPELLDALDSAEALEGAPEGDEDPDAAAKGAVADVAAELRPDPYRIEHKGFGRYQVVHNETGREMLPTSVKGKEAAEAALEAAYNMA